MDAPLQVRELVARYGEHTVLHGVELVVRRREILCVLGGSGCGKSTLLKHAIGLMRPAGGEVRLLGVDLAAADEEERRRALVRTGVLFQGGALLNSLTVAENVALALEQHTDLPAPVIRDIVQLKLALVGLRDAAHQLPPELSGGMRKRAALARSIALDPEIHFCDEPSAGLDPLTAAGIDRLIRDLRDALSMTVVVVTHEMASVAAIADRVVMLDDGKVLFDGTVPEMRDSEVAEVRDYLARKAPAGLAGETGLLPALGADDAPEEAG